MKLRVMDLKDGTVGKHTGLMREGGKNKPSRLSDKGLWVVKTCNAYQWDTLNKKEIICHPYDLLEI
jgi:hypothetical protein